jgi:hypothetical protein
VQRIKNAVPTYKVAEFDIEEKKRAEYRRNLAGLPSLSYKQNSSTASSSSTLTSISKLPRRLPPIESPEGFLKDRRLFPIPVVNEEDEDDNYEDDEYGHEA